METSELLKRVRHIEIKTRGLSSNIFAGEYHSAFKGRGMAFSEVREYSYGDDIRDIEWNVTARFNKPYIKVFEEERELTVMLLVDVSGSRNFGTMSQYKRDTIAEVAATLAFSTIENNDKVGCIFFSDKIEKVIPVKKGKSHVLHIIRELLDFEPTSKGTDVASAVQFFANAQKRHATAFLISDLVGIGSQVVTEGKKKGRLTIEQPLMIASSKHDMNVIQVYDRRDAELPDIGLLKLNDAETGERLWVNTSREDVRKAYSDAWTRQQTAIQDVFVRTGVNAVSMQTDQDYVRALMRLFKM